MTNYKARIKKLLKVLDQQATASAIVISSAPRLVRNRDNDFPFRQNSDFLYLTGSEYTEDSVLIVSTKLDKPVLIVPPVDEHKVLWEGAQPDPNKLARVVGATLLQTHHPVQETLRQLRGHESLYYQSVTGSLSATIASEVFKMPAYRRYVNRMPDTLTDSEVVMQELRLYKDAGEIALIKKAAEFTNNALHSAMRYLAPGTSEGDIAATLEYLFRAQGGSSAFGTIAASGANAGILHYRKCNRKLGKGELLLIDCGAEYKGYAADITRVVPVDGIFTVLQAEIYSAVLSAQTAAIRKVKHGARWIDVYRAAALELCTALKSLGVLEGPLSTLMSKRAYLPYFPHGIGHALGLDVHDPSMYREQPDRKIEAGMVFTIEPGLYFAKKTGRIPAMGIRIEDDVLVTRSGAKILSAGFPKDLIEIEEVLN
jgi:Xaa-Pro aminopeptidase